MMSENNLKEILSIPTSFGHEDLVKEYLYSHAKERGYEIDEDLAGNLYITKGKIDEGMYYPGLCAHIDTVFDGFSGKDNHTELVEKKMYKKIETENIEGKERYFALDPRTNKRTGLGGDDLAGVFIVLSILENIEYGKAIFFVMEEFGLQGSDCVDEEELKQIGYMFSFDAPTGKFYTKSIRGISLYTEEFDNLVYPVLRKHGIRKKDYLSTGLADVYNVVMKGNICSSNIGAGYYKYHTNDEYIIIKETMSMVNLGIELIKKLGNKKYNLHKI